MDKVEITLTNEQIASLPSVPAQLLPPPPEGFSWMVVAEDAKLYGVLVVIES